MFNRLTLTGTTQIQLIGYNPSINEYGSTAIEIVFELTHVNPPESFRLIVGYSNRSLGCNPQTISITRILPPISPYYANIILPEPLFGLADASQLLIDYNVW